jgi:hypothetical protein
MNLQTFDLCPRCGGANAQVVHFEVHGPTGVRDDHMLEHATESRDLVVCGSCGFRAEPAPDVPWRLDYDGAEWKLFEGDCQVFCRGAGWSTNDGRYKAADAGYHRVQGGFTTVFEAACWLYQEVARG